MVTTAFTRFDLRAFLENQNRQGDSAKPAKVAKVIERVPGQVRTFATFAPFAGPSEENHAAVSASDVWTDVKEERAAIVEHEGGVPRAWAEALARLDAGRPPADVPPRRWVAFVNDCGRFLDGGWAARAAALGWGPLDLFGCGRERPFARVDHMGLLWLLNGGELIALHRDHAVITTPRGARQTYRRRPVDLGRVVFAWELARS